jgi:hypothetical protein
MNSAAKTVSVGDKVRHVGTNVGTVVEVSEESARVRFEVPIKIGGKVIGFSPILYWLDSSALTVVS